MRSLTMALKPAAIFLGLGAACAACCLLPGAGILFAGTFLGSLSAGVGFGLLGWFGAIGAASVIALLLALAWRRVRPASCGAPQAACGCGASVAAEEAGPRVPIACSLTPQDRKLQLERIRTLARRSVQAAKREPLKLHLTYAVEAAEKVHEVVQVESLCCGFLDFDLRGDANGVYLTITAPESARDAAKILFDQFAPAQTLLRSPDAHLETPSPANIAPRNLAGLPPA